jgi:antitoxin (DNA-binding transcriptional repressor) of toxin-antitoxin stability system
MSETVLTVDDAARCLPDLVEQVHTSGKAALLVKAGRPVVRIAPFRDHEKDGKDLVAFLRRWRVEYPEPDEQLAEAIAESRRAIRPPHDPWE